MIPGLPFRWHPVVLALLIVVLVVSYRARLAKTDRFRVVGALFAAAVALLWPVGDLSAHVSLTFATTQRLLLILLVVPLLMLATPVAWLAKVTRPEPVDLVVRVVSQPGVAIVVVTVLGTLSVSPLLVDWGARSAWGHAVVLALTVCTGVVLWIPGLGVVPGARKLSEGGRAAYIFASSVVVTVLSFVWIFSTHSLYPDLHHQSEILGVTPLFDQQLAGFVAKLGTYAPLWALSFYVFFHAESAGRSLEETPLHWADVERQLLRVDRARARNLRHYRPE